MRALRVLALLAITVVGLAGLAAALLLAGLNTDPGRRLAERLILRATGGQVALTGLAGGFPAAPRLHLLELRDPGGVWLTVQDAALDWSPQSLLAGKAKIGSLTAARVVLVRLPAAADSPPAAAETTAAPAGGFALPLPVELARLHFDRLELGAPVAGTAAALAADGSFRLTALTAGTARLTLDRLDAPGRYRAEARIDAAGLTAQVQAEEPSGGLAGEAAGLPALGAIAAAAVLDGPWNAVAVKLDAAAGGLRAAATGALDLIAWTGTLDLTATAPAMQPRPDFSWQGATLAATLHGSFAAPEGTATLRLEGLQAAGAGLRLLSVQAAGQAGTATLDATAEGIRLPGPNPDLFAAAPLRLTAAAGLDAPGRPLRFSLAHPLAALAGTMQTAGPFSAEAALTLPDLAPLAATGGMAVQGHAALTLHATPEPEGTRLDLGGTIGVTGGTAPLPALLGPAAALDVSARLNGPDVSLTRLHLDGRTLSVTAQGALTGGAVTFDGHAGLSDLRVLPGGWQGSLVAKVQATGRTDDLAVSLDIAGDLASAGFSPHPVQAALAVTGLPGHPAATLTAGGTLDGAPLALAATAAQDADGALHLDIARADWRTSQAAGKLDLPPGAALPLGAMTVKLGDLDDFSRFAGRPLAGSLAATLRSEQADGVPVAVLDATARNAGLPGQVLLGEATLAARVRDPAGVKTTQARLSIAGLRAGEIGGGLRLDAAGPPDALALRLAANLTGVAGAPLALQTTATLNAPAGSLSVATLQATSQGRPLRLLAPAHFSTAEGIAVDRLRLGLGEAVLELAGRAAPTLDLTATLRNVTPDLARIFLPDLQAEGRLDGEAKLAGTLARPTGTLRLAATGLRGRDGPAAGFPPAALTATATLAGDTARLNAVLTAAQNRLTLTGTAPLATSGAIDLRAAGSLDLAGLDPLLTAGGQRLRGRLTLDLGVTGPLAAPRAAGTLRLAGGEAQDFSRGLRLSGIEALVQADGSTARLASFTAHAGRGDIAAAGTLGLAAPWPLALTLTARHASPLENDRLTESFDADLTLRGAAAGRLDAAGRVTLQRAELRLPERLPSGLAVLTLRHPGQPPPPPPAPPDLGLDVTLAAPGRIFLRGRGLDAELSGDLHLGGSLAAPQPDGSFKLVRGEFSLAGTTLAFSRGELGFDGSGSFDPTLDFLASTATNGVTANLAVTGYASAPKIALSSTPEMPPDEVLSFLIFHQSATSLGPVQLAQIARALAQISGVGGGFDPLGRLRSRLGLDRLSVGGGQGGKGAAVEAGRYLLPGVYVGAKQGIDGTGTQATVQIGLGHGLKLEATVAPNQSATGAGTTGQETAGTSAAGQSSGTSLGLTWQFDY